MGVGQTDVSGVTRERWGRVQVQEAAESSRWRQQVVGESVGGQFYNH